jgi:hypothetical protein
MSLHYQVVVLDSDINNAIQIESVSWKRSPIGVDAATFVDFKIYMGYSTNDQLSGTFLDNYMPGTRTLVFSRPNYPVVAGGPGNWFTTTLDTPFWYSGTNNLLIEFEWSDGEGSIYAYHWNAGTDRAVYGAYGSTTGDGFEATIPHLQLNGTLALEPESFGSIKAGFGQE